MASFCSNCRFPIAASASFCPQCGQAHVAVPSAPPPPAAAAANSGSAVKIVVIVFACFAAVGMAFVAVGFYAVHKVKQAVVAKADTYGVDLHNIPSPIPSSNATPKIYKPCEVLPKSEASGLLGQPIERTEIVELACAYYGPPGLAEKLATQNSTEMFDKAKTGAAMNAGDVADTVTKMMTAVAATSGENGTKGGEAPLLLFAIDRDGKAQMFAVAATKGIFGGIAADSKGGGLGAEIPNLGDRAIRLGPLGLNVLKGDTVIRIVVGPVPGANDKSVAIARAVLPRI
jgi:hypothetical protein